MSERLTVGVVRGSLPSYFPQQYGVFESCEAALQSLCEEEDARMVVAPDVPMNGPEAEAAAEHCAAEGADFILLIHGGFTMGDVARAIAASGRRMGVWATPEPTLEGDIKLNNFVSLNMTMSIARGVRDLERQPIQWYFGAPDSAEVLSRLRTSLRALGLMKRLRSTRIGLVGGVAPTFYNMEISFETLKSRLGVEVEELGIEALTDRMASLDSSLVASEAAKMAAVAPVRGVSEEQMALTARAALGLRQIASEGNFDGLAVSDWPALQEDPGMHPGAAFTWVEEVDNLPVASEGDVLGAVSQLAAKALTGKVGYLLDMTEPDLEAGDLLMWHGGGGPLYLADDRGAAWINHPMIGRGTPEGPRFGAIADLVFRDGPATAFRVSREGSAVFAMDAEVAGREPSGFDGCRGWLRDFAVAGVPASLDDVVATVMGHGLEHHFVLVPGHISEVLGEFARWTEQSILKVIPANGQAMPVA